MIDEKIKNYVATEHARGVETEAIRSALLAQGWKAEDVAEAIRLAMIEKGWSVDRVTPAAGAITPQSMSTGEGMFTGRLGKQKYLHIVLIGIAVVILAAIVFGFSMSGLMMGGIRPMGIGFSAIIFAIFTIGYGIMQLGASVRRLHDIGHSGWWVLLSFINIINIILLVYLCIKEGDTGPNKYGQPADPTVTFWQALRGSK